VVLVNDRANISKGWLGWIRTAKIEFKLVYGKIFELNKGQCEDEKLIFSFFFGREGEGAQGN